MLIPTEGLEDTITKVVWPCTQTGICRDIWSISYADMMHMPQQLISEPVS